MNLVYICFIILRCSSFLSAKVRRFSFPRNRMCTAFDVTIIWYSEYHTCTDIYVATLLRDVVPVGIGGVAAIQQVLYAGTQLERYVTEIQGIFRREIEHRIGRRTALAIFLTVL